LSENQKLVLAYLIKSEWANEQIQYTVLLTPDNNHFDELITLERQELISKHPSSTPMYPIYIADRAMVRKDYVPELRQRFGIKFDLLDELPKQVLSVIYRYNHFSKKQLVSAKVASFSLWYERGGVSGDIEQFDAFYRKVRYTFNRLQKDGFIAKQEGTRGYVLTSDGGANSLPLIISN
ncbi:MAG TPA: hypothetical protein VGC61_04700, partial [Pyrinomonadaceae bacterium]